MMSMMMVGVLRTQQIYIQPAVAHALSCSDHHNKCAGKKQNQTQITSACRTSHSTLVPWTVSPITLLHQSSCLTSRTMAPPLILTDPYANYISEPTKPFQSAPGTFSRRSAGRAARCISRESEHTAPPPPLHSMGERTKS